MAFTWVPGRGGEQSGEFLAAFGADGGEVVGVGLGEGLLEEGAEVFAVGGGCGEGVWCGGFVVGGGAGDVCGSRGVDDGGDGGPGEFLGVAEMPDLVVFVVWVDGDEREVCVRVSILSDEWRDGGRGEVEGGFERTGARDMSDTVVFFETESLIVFVVDVLVGGGVVLDALPDGRRSKTTARRLFHHVLHFDIVVDFFGVRAVFRRV